MQWRNDGVTAASIVTGAPLVVGPPPRQFCFIFNQRGGALTKKVTGGFGRLRYASVSLSVCVCVCLSVHGHIFGTRRPIFTKFLCVLPVAVARYSSGGEVIRYVLLVLWMTSCFLVSQGYSTSPPS